MFIGDVTVQLLQDWVVKVGVYKTLLRVFIQSCLSHNHSAIFALLQVNDEVVTLPLLREPYIYVERQTNTILLNTNIGLKVQSSVTHLSF